MKTTPARNRVSVYAAALAAIAICVAPTAPADQAQQGCGMVSLSRLCQILGRDLDTQQRSRLESMLPRQTCSMLDIKTAAETVQVHLAGVRASLSELSATPGPKILHLQHPDHFIVAARASQDWVQLLDGRRVIVVAREGIERRYSGEALIVKLDPEALVGPRLQLDEFHYPFGIAGVGQEVHHAFQLGNAGDQDLVVSLQSNGCGSLPASIGKTTLAPGEATDLTVQFTVARSGSVMGSVRLTTNDLTRPVAFVTIHGKVPHDLRVYPDRALLAGEKQAAHCSTITVSGPPEMDLGEVSCRGQELGLAVGEPKIGDDERKSWRITVSLQPGTLVGEFADELSIRTTHKDRPLITIPIRGTVVPDLDLQPPSAFFGFAKPGDKPAASINLTSRSGAPFRLLQVAPGDPRITVTQTETEGGYRLDVVVPTDKPGVFEGEVLVKTDVPLEEAVKIPVYVHVVQ